MSVYSFTDRYGFYILCKSACIFIGKDLVCSVNPFGIYRTHLYYIMYARKAYVIKLTVITMD